MGLVDLGLKGIKTAANVAAGVGKMGAEALLTQDAKRGYALSKKGWAAFGTVGAVSSLTRAHDTYNEDRMGTPSGAINATPQMPALDEYEARRAENYGAGGDLVFALNKNRRG